VGVINLQRVLPGVDDVIDDVFGAKAVPGLSEEEWTRAAHFDGVVFHDVEVGADGRSQVGFVDDEEVALGDARATFARDFVAAGNIDDLDGEVSEFAAVTRGQIVAAGFDEKNLRLEFLMQFFEGDEIRSDVFADGGVRTAASFNGANSFGGQGGVANEKLAIFFRENVVRDGGDIPLVAHASAKLQEQRCLAAAHRSADSDGEGAFRKIAVDRRIAVVEMAGVIEMFVRVAVRAVIVGMRMRVHGSGLKKARVEAVVSALPDVEQRSCVRDVGSR
jgi:hypothetical protein